MGKALQCGKIKMNNNANIIWGLEFCQIVASHENDVRILQDISEIWRHRTLSYLGKCRNLKAELAAERNVFNRYGLSLDLKHNMFLMREAFKVWRTVRRDKDASIQEIVNNMSK